MWNWLNKLVQIPGRLTSIAMEKVVCGADEVWDDTLQKRQDELNAQFKAVTDQEQIAINGGMAEIASGAGDIVPGSGAIVTANAVAGVLAGYFKGVSQTENVTESMTFAETVGIGEQKTIIFENNTDAELTVTVPNSTYKTPDGEVISIPIPAGGYGEVNILNIGGTIFARGC